MTLEEMQLSLDNVVLLLKEHETRLKMMDLVINSIIGNIQNTYEYMKRQEERTKHENDE